MRRSVAHVLVSRSSPIRLTREFATHPRSSFLSGAATSNSCVRHPLPGAALGSRYDESAHLWRVRYADAGKVAERGAARGLRPGEQLSGDDFAGLPYTELSARVVVSAMGGLSTPAYPALEGLERFRGKTFHSQRWDSSFDLKGKRVAVLGTGASPPIRAANPAAGGTARLYQRSAAWVLPRRTRASASSSGRCCAGCPRTACAPSWRSIRG